ncbi:MAG: AzlC family ABC transporter permease [Duodenibacillus sp.]|nr:AzlC family ABC transporter permease [Duodenibacillus sp.]
MRLSEERAAMLAGLRDASPVMLGYLPLSLVFGYLFVQAGGHPLLAFLMSLAVYAGAAQFMAIPMLAAGVPVPVIAFATFVLNLRHVFYGLPLLERFPRRGLRRLYMIFGLTDEVYSVFTAAAQQEASHARMFWTALFSQSSWAGGTLVGALAGAGLPAAFTGLDFVLTSLFAVLACEQWRGRTQSWPLWAAAALYALCKWLAPGMELFLSIAGCVALAVAFSMRRRRENGHA